MDPRTQRAVHREERRVTRDRLGAAPAVRDPKADWEQFRAVKTAYMQRLAQDRLRRSGD